MEVENTQAAFQSQLAQLIQKEKVARQNDQFLETGRILIQVVTLCWEHKELATLREQLLSLSKKRGQPKKAQIGMVQLAMGYLTHLDQTEQGLLINCLKTVCEKKIYLEVEYARLCLASVKLMEDESNIEEAARIMQEVQVETYGSMDKREKLEFILYQMKIMIKKRDYVRLYIISKKINEKSIISEEGFEDLRVIFHCYLVVYYMQEALFRQASQSHRAIFDCLHAAPALQDKLQASDELTQFGIHVSAQASFENYVCLLLISDFCPDKTSSITHLLNNYQRVLLKYPYLNDIVTAMTGNELVPPQFNRYSLEQVQVFLPEFPQQEVHRDCLFRQLVQHDLRIIENYYSEISLERIANLLDTDQGVCEQELCRQINQKVIVGRIDRVQGTVSFSRKQNENQQLGLWQKDIHQVLDLLDRTCKLIQRENELQKAH